MGSSETLGHCLTRESPRQSKTVLNDGHSVFVIFSLTAVPPLCRILRSRNNGRIHFKTLLSVRGFSAGYSRISVVRPSKAAPRLMGRLPADIIIRKLCPLIRRPPAKPAFLLQTYANSFFESFVPQVLAFILIQLNSLPNKCKRSAFPRVVKSQCCFSLEFNALPKEGITLFSAPRAYIRKMRDQAQLFENWGA